MTSYTNKQPWWPPELDEFRSYFLTRTVDDGFGHVDALAVQKEVNRVKGLLIDNTTQKVRSILKGNTGTFGIDSIIKRHAREEEEDVPVTFQRDGETGRWFRYETDPKTGKPKIYDCTREERTPEDCERASELDELYKRSVPDTHPSEPAKPAVQKQDFFYGKAALAGRVYDKRHLLVNRIERALREND